MARWSGAIWQPGAPFGGALRPIAVTLHHQAGNGNPLPVYISRRVSAHFWIPKSGQPVQHVDTSNQAWHGVAHNQFGIGVETEGCGAPPHSEPLTEHQINQFAALMRWANQTHGIPLRLSEAVDQPGLNYHRCRGGPSTSCPCAMRVNARAEILRRAGAAITPPTPPEEDMPLNDADKQWLAHNTLNQMAVMMRSPEFQGIIRNQVEAILRSQFSNPNGECFGRVIQASNSSIQQSAGKFIDWAKQGAQQAK